jgi:RNA exonuclease 1
MGKKRKGDAEGEEGEPKAKRNPQRSVDNSKTPPALNFSTARRPHNYVKIGDLQQLVLYLLVDRGKPSSPAAPNWIAIQNRSGFERVVVLMVPGLSMDLFFAHDEELESTETKESGRKAFSPDEYYPKSLDDDTVPEAVKPLKEIFDRVWPIRASGDERYSRIVSPVSSILSSSVPKDVKQQAYKRDSHRTPITTFLASKSDLESNDFILHPLFSDNNQKLPEEWVSTNVQNLDLGKTDEQFAESGSITQGRQIFSIDCEMCSIGAGKLALTRISVVDWNGEVVLDELVKPDEPIVDYLTQYSGVTESMLNNVTTNLRDIQAKLLKIVEPTTIIVGHSLDSDFNALKFTHPFVVDTSLLYPHPRGHPFKQSLKYITKQHLKRDIQQKHGSSGHDSIEDAKAVMDLIKLKCENGPHFGMLDFENEPIVQRLARDFADPNMFRSSIFDWKDVRNGYASRAGTSRDCDDDADVVEEIAKVMRSATLDTEHNQAMDDADDRDNVGDTNKQQSASANTTPTACRPTFLWAALRRLERARGWANGSSRNQPRGYLPEGVNAHNGLDNAKSSNAESTSPQFPNLDQALSATANDISKIYQSLPPGTAFLVYSGTGDQRDLNRMVALHKQFKTEYQTKKWDELTVKWTSVEDDARRAAYRQAIEGIGMFAVKT